MEQRREREVGDVGQREKSLREIQVTWTLLPNPEISTASSPWIRWLSRELYSTRQLHGSFY